MRSAKAAPAMRAPKARAEEQQPTSAGEADHHAHPVDLELPHARDPNAKTGRTNVSTANSRQPSNQL